MRSRVCLFAIAATCALTSYASADVITWNAGTVGNWNTAGNWTPSSVPVINGAAPDVVNILDGEVTYSGTSGDWANNTTVTVDGANAKWVQSTINWLKIGDGAGNTGTLNVKNGGSFDISAADVAFVGNGGGTGTVNADGGTFKAKTINVNAGSSLTISNGGAVNATTLNVNSTGHLTITSGTVTNTGEMHPTGAGNVVTINGGTVTNAIVSFDGSASATIDLMAGTLVSSNGTFWDGVYSVGGYVNFTPGSTGVFDLLNNATSSNANALLTSGRVRFDGAIAPSAFTVTTVDSGVQIALAAIVPEPASISLLGLAAVSLLRRRKA